MEEAQHGETRLGVLLHNANTAWVVLAISVAMTVLAWYVSSQLAEREARQRFQESVDLAQLSTRQRMLAYPAILRAGGGLFASSQAVTREEWRTFVRPQQLNKAYPGMQGLGYAVMVPRPDKAGLEASIRAEGLRDLTEFKAREAERAKAEAMIRCLGFQDPLTQLPNRRLLADRLRQAMTAARRRRRHGALMFIDMDNFKQLNDSLGHEMGDLLLIEVANRLKACAREEDTVARLGGDEFVVMLAGLAVDAEESVMQAVRVGEKILDSRNQPYQLDVHVYRSTPSIGATLFLDDSEHVDALFNRAETAMYQVKSAGRNGLRFFDADMQTLLSDRALLEDCLNRSQPDISLVLHYQPLMSPDGKAIGAEALVRWQHPQRGLLMPAEFLDLAEESGLAVRLGRRVLELACAQLAVWANQPDLADYDLSVNVSARHLRQPGLVEEVRQVLLQSGARSERLILELGEVLMLQGQNGLVDTMLALKQLGIRFSLDNFGACYFSLGSQLRTLPFDQLKLEQTSLMSCTDGQPDTGLVHSLVSLGNSLGPGVSVKGVETGAQWACLRHPGFRQVQGYLFSRPVSADELENLLRLRSPGG